MIECKFNSKSCIIPFKSTAVIEKNLSSLEIFIDKDKDGATFTFNSENRDDLSHEVNFINTNLQNDLDMDEEYDYYFMAKNKTLLNLFSIFPNQNDLCVMTVEEDHVYFETYNFKLNEVRTKFVVKSEVFSEYKITGKIKTTFNLKPMKTFLNAIDKNARCYFYFQEDFLPVNVVVRTELVEQKFIMSYVEIDIGSINECTTR